MKGMRAAVLYESGSPLVIDNVELQGPGPDEVLVRVSACGVCHSDLHMIKGDWVGFDPPIIVGHEGAGIVEQVGDNVTSVEPGDHVVLGWRTTCGECRYCITGRPYLCSNSPGIDPNTAIWRGDQRISFARITAYFAEYAVVHRTAAVPIRQDMPLDRASLLACSVMTGVGTATNIARVRPGTSAAVFGCGGVGLNVIQGAALCGAARIIAVDIADDKLAFARQFGVTDTVNAANHDPVEAIMELTGGAGVDYAFEAAGRAETAEQAFASLCPGGKAVIAGLPAFRHSLQLSIPFMPLFGDRWLTAAYYGGAVLWRDIPRLVELYFAGKLEVDRLITRRYPLDEINEAFADLVNGGPGRGVIMF